MSVQFQGLAKMRPFLACLAGAARDPYSLASDWALLDLRERQRALELEASRQGRFIATRALVRRALSDSCGAGDAPKAWSFSENEYGKPRVSQADSGGEAIEFSVSHTDELTVVAVMRGVAIGVDVEDTSVDLPWLEVARHFFAPEEIKLLACCEEAEGKSRFYAYWTAKESVLKALGCGLQGRLDGVIVDFACAEGEGIKVSLVERRHGDSSEVSVMQFRYRQRFLISVCVDGAALVDPVVRSYG